MNSIISPNASLAPSVTIGHSSVIHDNVIMDEGVRVGDFCVLGEPSANAANPLRIGKGSRIRSHCVIYQGCDFSAGIETGHHVLIRENTVAGRLLRVGSFCDIEGDCSFGDFVRLHGYVHVGKGSRIGNFVFLYSLVTLTNDPLPPSTLHLPVVLEDGVVVCVGSTVLPGSIMKTGSMAAAQSTVRGTVPSGVIVGEDGRLQGHVTRLMNLQSGLRHPWMNHYHTTYPEEAQDRIQTLKLQIIQGAPS